MKAPPAPALLVCPVWLGDLVGAAWVESEKNLLQQNVSDL